LRSNEYLHAFADLTLETFRHAVVGSIQPIIDELQSVDDHHRPLALTLQRKTRRYVIHVSTAKIEC
jgi:hypothetical protein